MMKRHSGLLALAIMIVSMGAAPARADIRLGTLACTFEDRFTAAFRNVACVYTRANGVIETYSGYTGFTDLGRLQQAFDVFSTTASDPSGLQGDYDVKLVTDAVPAGALVGPGSLYLLSRSGDGVPLDAVLNKLTGLEKLHLVFAGVTYPDRHIAWPKHRQ